MNNIAKHVINGAPWSSGYVLTSNQKPFKAMRSNPTQGQILKVRKLSG